MTIFKTVIAGDDWGQLAVPIVEAAPWTSVLFVLIWATIGLGLLNLIIAVILDCASKAQQADVEQNIREKEEEFHGLRIKMLAICDSMDSDGDGEISLEELYRGYVEHPEFGAVLSSMDVEEGDLRILFQIMDEDHSGAVSHKEFVEQLYNLKSKDQRTMLMFIKHHCSILVGDVKAQLQLLESGVLNGLSSISDAVGCVAESESGMPPRRRLSVSSEMSDGSEISPTHAIPANLPEPSPCDIEARLRKALNTVTELVAECCRERERSVANCASRTEELWSPNHWATEVAPVDRSRKGSKVESPAPREVSHDSVQELRGTWTRKAPDACRVGVEVSSGTPRASDELDWA